MNVAGGWTITEDALNCPACTLPEDVAAAFSQVTGKMVGAGYEPLLHAATQVVNGTNHMILCRETLSDAEHTVKISTMILNVPAVGEPQIVVINSLF